MFDTIFYNGKIHTMKQEGDLVEAMAVYAGKILRTGTTEELKGEPAKEYVDLGGKTVIPGLMDTHMHIFMDFQTKTKVDLNTAKSFEDVIRLLDEKKKTIKEGQWILGWGLHMERLKEQCFPTREVLDRVSTQIPIGIASFCGHANILNSKALEICGIGPGFEPELPGTVEFGEDKKPTGIIREETYSYYVQPKIPALSREEAMEGMEEYFRELAAQGITTIHPNIIEDPFGLEFYQEIYRKGKLLSRMVYYPTNMPVTSTGAVSGFGDDMLKLGATKMFMDGSIGAASSAMFEPYADVDTCGTLLMDQEETDRRVKEAYDAGMDIAVHAIGDRAIDTILTAFERAYDPAKGWNQRFYLIHGYLATEEQMERMTKLPLVVPTQPVFIRNFVGMARQRLGEERTARLFPQKTFLKKGVLVTGSSDAPVQSTNPFYGIGCAVTRKAPGCEELIAPEEAISVYEAVDMYTRLAAYVGKDEDKKGTLEPGKLADFAVLDRDIFTVEPEAVFDTKVEMTVLDGKIVYKA